MDTRYPTPVHSSDPFSPLPRKPDPSFAEPPSVHPTVLTAALSAPQFAATPVPRSEADQLIQLRYEEYLARGAVQVLFENGELECLGC